MFAEYDIHISMEFCGIQYWPMFTFIFQFKSTFAKLSDKTVNCLKSTDYFSNDQNSTAAQKIIFH